MKIRFVILILAINISASENSVYDWHVSTIERDDADFGDELKLQTALNKERQQDLLKFSAHINNMETKTNNNYNLLRKNIESKNINVNNGEDENQNLLNNGIYGKQEENPNFQTILNELNTYKPVGNFKNNGKKTVFSNDGEHRRHMYNSKQNNVLKNDQYSNYQKREHLQINKKQNTNKNNEILTLIDSESFLGTNLFDTPVKKCFSNEDAALLVIRKDLESLVPKYLPESLFDDRTVALLMNYFYICHQIVTRTPAARSRHLVQKAFYDTLGGFLNFYMVPVTKYSFYAGQISLNTANQVLLLHEETKKFLNTNGNGWRAPLQNVLSQLKSVHIEPLHIPKTDEEAGSEPSFCMQLCMNTDENQPDNDKMIVQLPKIEAENLKGFLGNIWLPFRRKRTFDLKLQSSAYIVVKFYETLTKCYRFENIDQDFFNQQFKTWLMENIIIHLSDEEFYPGLGAILRVTEFLKESKKRFIDIDKDLYVMKNIDEKFNKYRSYKIKQESIPKRRKTNHNTFVTNNKEFKKNEEKSEREKLKISKAHLENDAKLVSSYDEESENPKTLFGSFDFSLPQIAIIAIPIIAVILVIIVCCWKCFCKKKKPPVQPEPIKHSSSSSSNLFNSPARFFYVKKKSASTIEKGNKSSVKIEKEPLINSDTTGKSSPMKNIKSKESNGSRKSKNSDKSNSKSSWETTFSSK